VAANEEDLEKCNKVLIEHMFQYQNEIQLEDFIKTKF